MFRTVVVPLDGTPFAEQALPWALSIARRARAGLGLVRGHVLYALREPAAAWVPFDPLEEAECKREEQLYLDGTARWLSSMAPVPVSTALVPGVDAEGLLAYIQENRPDLVVMATHRRGPVGRFVLGSVADQVVRRSGAPVLLVRSTAEPLPEPAPARLLVPLDGSALAEQALGPAAELARALEVRCAVVRVVVPDETEADARIYLQGIAERLRNEGLRVETRVLAARHASEAILHLLGPDDVVALATHGRGGLGRIVLGSVADQVIRSAPCAVLVYRPGAV